MKYAFLTMLFPEDLRQEVDYNSKRNMQDAANVLQHNIFSGLKANIDNEISVFNVMPVGSFPQYYRKAFIKESKFKIGENSENINLGFCNIKLIKQFDQSRKIIKVLKKWCNDKQKKTLFVYSLSAPFTKAISKLKKKYNINIVVIIADLPNMLNLSSNQSKLQLIYSKYQSNVVYKRLKHFDYFVLLAKQMADYLNIKDKPFCVMEGISTNISSYGNVERKNDGIKRIFYSGTLHKKFGILNLLEAFKRINEKNYRLQLCGIGDCEEIIKKECEKDFRIEFLGQIKREEVLKIQKQATVLVNPRQNNEEFTKYSFPSKNLEYLASGTPVISYKLDGIPDEYDKYLLYVSDNSIESLKRKIEEVCSLSEEERKNIGDNGRDFVLKEKNSKKQIRKILDMIESN